MLLGTAQKRRRQRDGVVNLNAAVGQVEGHQIASFGGSSAILFAVDGISLTVGEISCYSQDGFRRTRCAAVDDECDVDIGVVWRNFVGVVVIFISAHQQKRLGGLVEVGDLCFQPILHRIVCSVGVGVPEPVCFRSECLVVDEQRNQRNPDFIAASAIATNVDNQILAFAAHKLAHRICHPFIGGVFAGARRNANQVGVLIDASG